MYSSNIMIKEETESVLYLDIEEELLMLEELFRGNIDKSTIGLYKYGIRYSLLKNNTSYYLQPSGIELDIFNLPYDTGQDICSYDGEVIIHNSVMHAQRVSNTPFHSTVIINIILDMFNKILYDNNPYRELYFKDILNVSSNIKLMSEEVLNFNYLEDIIPYHMPGISNIHMTKLYNKLSIIFIQPLTGFMFNHETNIYEIDVSKNFIQISRGCDIRAKRYELAHSVDDATNVLYDEDNKDLLGV